MSNPLSPLFTPLTPKLTLPVAYRQWARFVCKCEGGCFQVNAIKQAVNDGVIGADRVLDFCCEVFARATFETVISIDYDSIDSKVDMHVYNDIHQQFGANIANAVLNECQSLFSTREEG